MGRVNLQYNSNDAFLFDGTIYVSRVKWRLLEKSVNVNFDSLLSNLFLILLACNKTENIQPSYRSPLIKATGIE